MRSTRNQSWQRSHQTPPSAVNRPKNQPTGSPQYGQYRGRSADGSSRIAAPCHETAAEPALAGTGEGESARYNRERMFDARQHLGDGSPLEGSLPGFRVRGEQLALADAVAACLSGDGHLIAEAGTGVGKSLAYLVPIAFAGRTVVVSTYTKALQDQLRTNDVPLAREASGMPLTAAVVKGRGNYLCRAQLETVESRIELWDVDGWQRAATVGAGHEDAATATASTTCRRRRCGASWRWAPSAAAAGAARSSTAATPSAPAPRRARPTWCSSTTPCTWPTSACARPRTAPSRSCRRTTW